MQFISNHLTEHLEEHFDPINQVPQEYRARYAGTIGLVWKNQDNGVNPHKAHPELAPMPTMVLRDIYGKGKFAEINEKVGAIKRHEGTYQKGYCAYGYSIENPQLIQALKSFDLNLIRGELEPSPIVDSEGRKIRTRKNQHNAIYKDDSKGNPRKSSTAVPPFVEVNAGAIQKRICDLSESGQQGSPNNNEFFDELKELRQWIYNTDYPKGYLPQYYTEYLSGRIFSRGKVNLQNMSSEARAVALSDMEYHEYDFSNCNFVLFYHKAKEVGSDCPTVKRYIKSTESKEEFRKGCARAALGQEIDQGIVGPGQAISAVKDVLLAKVNGARNSQVICIQSRGGEWVEMSIPNSLAVNEVVNGAKAAKRLYQFQPFKDISREVGQAIPQILEKAKADSKRRSGYVNEMGKEISQTATRGQKMSHLLQGAEARAHNVVLNDQNAGEKTEQQNVLVPRHDGFIVRDRLDTERLEQKIADKTGYRLTIEHEQTY